MQIKLFKPEYESFILKHPEPNFMNRFFGKWSLSMHIIIINLCFYLLVLILEEGKEIWKFGNLHRTLIFEKGQYYRFITSFFLHSPNFFLHILLNMLALFTLGPFTEVIYGRINFFNIYMVSGLMSSITSYYISQSNLHNANPETTGSSGAVFGLIGAILYFLQQHRKQLNHDIRKRLLRNLYFVIILNLFLGFILNQINISIHIDNLSHLAGILSGFCISFITKPIILGYYTKLNLKLAFIMLIMLCVSFAWAIINYFQLFLQKNNNWVDQINL